MKTTLLLLLLTFTFSFYSQENKLTGIYTEYKRSLWNNDDGSKYTVSQKPFEPKLQFDFNDGKATIYDGNNKNEYLYRITEDTLIFSMEVGKGKSARTIYTKYIILENKNELVLREFKDGLDKNYYLKKYYLKKSKELHQDYLSKNNFEIYTLVEEEPSFPGGVEELRKFVSSEVSKSDLKGNEKVFLKLLITPEGKILNIDVLNSPRIEYVEEAVKITRKFPAFSPGKQNGKPVYVYYNFPVKFINP